MSFCRYGDHGLSRLLLYTAVLHPDKDPLSVKLYSCPVLKIYGVCGFCLFLLKVIGLFRYGKAQGQPEAILKKIILSGFSR